MVNLIIIFVFIFNIPLLYSQNEIKNIFDPNNLRNEEEPSSDQKISKNFDFILYGIINTGKIKKVILKPKTFSKDIKNKLNNHEYIILKVGETFQNIKLISIDNDTAKFKKGEEIYSVRVFQNEKYDRIITKKTTSPKIINTTFPSTYQKNINSKKNIKNSKIKKLNIKTKKIKKEKRKSSIPKQQNNNRGNNNPFLEILKKMNKNKSSSSPGTNPFLNLINQRRKP